MVPSFRMCAMRASLFIATFKPIDACLQVVVVGERSWF
jgi:hypothetical protein